jgi:hypothetical protein
MLEKMWIILSLHTRKARIIFLAAMIFILVTTMMGAFYWYAP